MSRSILRKCIAGTALSSSIIFAAVAPGLADTLQITGNHPLNGDWQVYHNAATAVCGGMPLPISADGPDRVTIEPTGEGTVLVNGIEGQLTMRRVTAQRFETSQIDGMQVLKRIDAGEWGLLAEAVNDSGLVYTGRKDVGGGTLSYLLGWLKSEPDTLNGHLTMTEGPCQVLRSFRAER